MILSLAKNTVDILKNKTLTDVSNTVWANSMRNGSTWVVPYGGSAPIAGDKLIYDGTNAIWTNVDDYGGFSQTYTIPNIAFPSTVYHGMQFCEITLTDGHANIQIQLSVYGVSLGI